MLTIVDVNGAIDPSGAGARVPRAARRRLAVAAAPRAATVAHRTRAALGSSAAPAPVIRAERRGARPVVQEGPSGEIEPEIVLPVQVDDLERRCGRPEHQLLRAALEDAVFTYLRRCTSSRLADRALFVETSAWFASDDAGSLFCFVSICQHLTLDPAYVRAGLRRWRDADGRATPRRIRRPAGSRHRVIRVRRRQQPSRGRRASIRAGSTPG
jgi:hypothetical protein